MAAKEYILPEDLFGNMHFNAFTSKNSFAFALKCKIERAAALSIFLFAFNSA